MDGPVLFYASVSVVLAAVLGLGAGVILGARLMNRFKAGLEKLFDNPEYRNTAGAAFVLTQIDRMCKTDGMTVEKIAAYVDEEVDRVVSAMETPEAGRVIGEALLDRDEERDPESTWEEDDHG